MTTKSDYTADEWDTIMEAPLKIATAVVASGTPGPVQMVQESLALARALAEPLQTASSNALVNAVANEFKAIAQDREQRKAEQAELRAELKVDPNDPNALQTVRSLGVEAARQAAAIVTAKASADEAAGFKTWLLSVAQRVAEGAKEGGFLGFGGTRVTTEEQATIREIADALGVAAPA
jgi:hypothetical protein